MSIEYESEEDSGNSNLSSDNDQLIILNYVQKLSDVTLFQIFKYLNANELISASAVCHQWLRICRDDHLWKRRFRIDFYKSINSLCKDHQQLIWLHEYRRLIDECPKIETDCLVGHSDQVLHVTFSTKGDMIATCSMDGTLKVWRQENDGSKGDAHWSVCHDKNLRQLLYWRYTLRSRFNSTDRLLLVSGLRAGESASNASLHNNNINNNSNNSIIGLGEIAIFEFVQTDKNKNQTDQDQQDQDKKSIPIYELTFRCRAINEPFDVYGCWYDYESILNGQSRWFDQTSTMSDVYFLNAAGERTTSTRLFQFYNENGGVVRSLLVSGYVRQRSTSPEREGCSSSQQQQRSIDRSMTDRLLIFTTGRRIDTPHQIGVKIVRRERVTGPMDAANFGSTKKKNQNENCEKYKPKKTLLSTTASSNNNKNNELSSEKTEEENLTNVDENGKNADKEIEREEVEEKNDNNSKDQLLQESDNNKNIADENKNKVDESSGDDEEEEEEEDNEENESPMQQVQIRVHTFDRIDRVLEMGGRIVGMALSNDHRYVFVNIRPFVIIDNGHEHDEDADASNPQQSPLLENRSEIRVIDLQTMTLLDNTRLTVSENENGQQLTSDQTTIPPFFIDLDACDQYVVSGANEGRALLWDRRHGCFVRCLRHSCGSGPVEPNCSDKIDNCAHVHSVAFHPFDPTMCASASGDGTIKIWRSQAYVRQKTYSK